MIQMVPIGTVDDAAVERLLDVAFGADRHTRTAYRLRAGIRAIPELSFALVGDDRLLGSIQCWPVRFDADDGTTWPLVLVGPVAVAPDRQQEGHGRRLMEAALTAAAGGPPLMLIGDPEYYGRFFGFDAAATALWRLPGPVERHRLLARGAGVPSGGGAVGPRVAADAAASQQSHDLYRGRPAS
ncbi:GCN5 family acetyltransferase [Sphingomonas sp. Leaf231]|uniref:GNAT family N-acetyltransferase n=1 Tax=Sphingomonas sp. Leaf231 TaxID=1736301 RepID=UPI0006F2E8F7|nr:N-acetyltransferase [Sphingomonas sp. Leaf231]KQN92846.1 GCN5 family acetyltransferase [Sphingomonas sp. Leaf231]